MKYILILYPSAFNCYEKFFRKVSRIISDTERFILVFSDDPNNLINRFSDENSEKIELLHVDKWSVKSITHGIVFDDGEEFHEEIELLTSNNIPLRIIRISITRVVNIKKETEYQYEKSTPGYEYIGRGSYWGNPYSMYEGGDGRDEVIRKYKYDFDFEKFPNKEKIEVYKLAGKRLGCFCKPQSCHGDVLADYLNSWDDGK